MLDAECLMLEHLPDTLTKASTWGGRTDAWDGLPYKAQPFSTNAKTTFRWAYMDLVEVIYAISCDFLHCWSWISRQDGPRGSCDAPRSIWYPPTKKCKMAILPLSKKKAPFPYHVRSLEVPWRVGDGALPMPDPPWASRWRSRRLAPASAAIFDISTKLLESIFIY